MSRRVLSVPLPEGFEVRKEIRKGWPIPPEKFQLLAREIEGAIRTSGIEVPELQPGDIFQPGFLDVPSKPRADFLWSSLHSLVVSERTRNLFTSLRVKDVEFLSVTLRKIGNREANLRHPIPPSGEPEYMLASVPLLKKTDELGPYYQMVIKASSHYPPGGESLWVCPSCGWERRPPASEIRFVMLDSMWQGHDVFYLGGTSFVMVTDRLKMSLQEIGATNVAYRSRTEEQRWGQPMG